MQLTTSDNARCHAGMQRRPLGYRQTNLSNTRHWSSARAAPHSNAIFIRAPQQHATQHCASHHNAALWHATSSQPNITKALAKQDTSHTRSGYWRPNISPIPRHHQQAQPPSDRTPMQECDSTTLRPARHSHRRTALPCKKVKTNRPLESQRRATPPCGSRYPAPLARNSNSPAHHVCQSILTDPSHVSRTRVKHIRWYPEAPCAIL